MPTSEVPGLPAPGPSAPTFDRVWGVPGTSQGQLHNPFGMDFDPSGNVLIADGNTRVQAFDPQGVVQYQIGSSGTAPGQFRFSRDVAVRFDQTGQELHIAYVADGGNHRVQKFDLAGNLLGILGAAGIGPGLFHQPVGVAVGSGGDVYVVAQNTHEIVVFDDRGDFLFEWGGLGTATG